MQASHTIVPAEDSEAIPIAEVILKNIINDITDKVTDDWDINSEIIAIEMMKSPRLFRWRRILSL